MVYKDLQKPTAQMMASQTEIARDTHNMLVEQYNADQARIQHEATVAMADIVAKEKELTDRLLEQSFAAQNKAGFLTNVKNAFLASCIYRVYRESCVSTLTPQDVTVVKNVINRFVTENGGATRLCTEWRTKNLLLSEMVRITEKYYTRVVESFDDMQSKEFKLDNTIKNDFYEEIKNLDVEDAAKLIRHRISDAITEFIDTNTDQKIETEEIIAAANDQIASAKDETVAESHAIVARRNISESSLRQKKNVFHAMVEGLIKRSFADGALKKKYVAESTVNTQAIVDDITLVYTMLEVANTTNMVNIDGDYITKYLEGMK